MAEDWSPYEGTSPVAPLEHHTGRVTLVEGQTFCLSGRAGDVLDDLPHGLFVLDRRVLSVWELWLNGHRVEPLAVDEEDPFTATFVGRGRPSPGHADADLVVHRRRRIGNGLREELEIENHGLAAATVELRLRCWSDFADVFAVKESRATGRGQVEVTATADGGVRFVDRAPNGGRSVEVRTSTPAAWDGAALCWQLELPAGGSWSTCLEGELSLGDRPVELRFRCGGDDAAALPLQRLSRWQATLPVVETDDAALAEALVQTGEDLGALRIFDPEHPDLPVLAAGAPWFMTVFGRDSLLTAWMTLLADHSLARGVLETLARWQGRDDDPRTEEEPGKIVHEVRFGDTAGLALGGGDAYYGSVDATPLFVMLLGELRRWDPDDGLVDRLLPAADRALAWIKERGDRDGDGYVEYERRNPRGLVNQGWKDSWDAVRHLDGELAEPPIALAEVQGYVYAAYIARAHFALEAGELDTYERYRDRAATLRARFNEDFWLEDRGWFAMALDRDKRPVEALASNIGHCLWTGIVDPDLAPLVAARLVGDDLFSGWGVRTLARSMPAFNPVSYHNGSVWPHDNAIAAAGLARYGFVDEVHRIISAQLDAAASHRGQLPELFAGFDRRRLRTPA
ncbi:MAG: glycogen debranching N-terminal domain-containing protein, partial [Actinomycetota bacterium]